MFNDFSINIPLQKINKEKRIVTGIATANNVDLENDQIDFEASLEAFGDWVGNIREMHQPKAVGTLVDYRPTQIMYKGKIIDAIEVDVYISKGAEDTWQKILDKTLKGFSIGGRALEKENRIDPETGQMVQYISKYMLNELSVVDNPCNPAGMFMLIKRAEDGSLVSAQEADPMSVYYCPVHKYATIDDNRYCPTCSKEMTMIGTVDTFNAEVINKMVSNFDQEGETMDLHEKTNDASMTNTMNDLTDEQKQGLATRLVDALFKNTSSETPEVATPNVVVNIHKGLFDEEKVEEEVSDDTVEKSVDAGSDEISDKEETMAEVDIEAILKGVGTLLDTKLAEVKTELSTEMDEKIGAISKSVDDFKEETTETLVKNAEEIEKVSKAGAVQKSVDVDDEADEDKIEKSVKMDDSFWGNAWVPQELISALGYES